MKNSRKYRNIGVLRKNLLTLRELRSTSCSFETVLLSFLHSGVTSEEAFLLEESSELGVSLEECSGKTVSDSTCLTCNAAACNCADDVELVSSIGNAEGLTNDELQGLKAKVVVDISAVDGNLTGTWINSNSCNGVLSSACSVVIWLLIRTFKAAPD